MDVQVRSSSTAMGRIQAMSLNSNPGDPGSLSVRVPVARHTAARAISR